MAVQPSVDAVLVTWGDRLFYPGNRMVRGADAVRLRAALIRRHIEATVVRRAPQVMVKVTGGGRSMNAIGAHFRYISKNGRLEVEDQRGEVLHGKESVRELVEEWRFSGSLIPETSELGWRREAFNIMLSMPRGTDPLSVQRAARDFAKTELAGHKYVMVLHDHQANPHVHISVRTESRTGTRLRPRKPDLHRWRETFAEKLRDLGLDAEASSQASRCLTRTSEPLWQVKARGEGRLRNAQPSRRGGRAAHVVRPEVGEAWKRLGRALERSPEVSDRSLARAVDKMLEEASNGSRRRSVAESARSDHIPLTGIRDRTR